MLAICFRFLDSFSMLFFSSSAAARVSSRLPTSLQ